MGRSVNRRPAPSLTCPAGTQAQAAFLRSPRQCRQERPSIPSRRRTQNAHPLQSRIRIGLLPQRPRFVPSANLPLLMRRRQQERRPSGVSPHASALPCEEHASLERAKMTRTPRRRRRNSTPETVEILACAVFLATRSQNHLRDSDACPSSDYTLNSLEASDAPHKTMLLNTIQGTIAKSR